MKIQFTKIGTTSSIFYPLILLLDQNNIRKKFKNKIYKLIFVIKMIHKSKNKEKKYIYSLRINIFKKCFKKLFSSLQIIIKYIHYSRKIIYYNFINTNLLKRYIRIMSLSNLI